MSYAYEINASSGTVKVKFSDQLVASDIAGYADALRADPLFNPAFSEVIDLRHVVHVDLNAKQAVTLADHADPFSLTSRRAFIVQTVSQKNAARMHHILRGGKGNIQIFHSLQEALHWLALQE